MVSLRVRSRGSVVPDTDGRMGNGNKGAVGFFFRRILKKVEATRSFDWSAWRLLIACSGLSNEPFDGRDIGVGGVICESRLLIGGAP